MVTPQLLDRLRNTKPTEDSLESLDNLQRILNKPTKNFDIDKDVLSYVEKYRSSTKHRPIDNNLRPVSKTGVGAEFNIKQSGVVDEQTGAGQVFDKWRLQHSTKYNVSAEKRTTLV